MDNASIKAAYDQLAPAYARTFARELDEKPFDRLLLDGIARELKGKVAVLEVGCGPGHVAAYLHARGVDITGTDLSPAMIDEARALFSTVPYRTLDMLAMDVPDASVHGIIGFYAIVNFDPAQLERALREMGRVLVPEGLLALAFHAGNGPVHVDELLGEKVSMEFRNFDPGEMRVRLKRLGMKVDEVTVRPPYAQEHPTKRAYILAHAPKAS